MQVFLYKIEIQCNKLIWNTFELPENRTKQISTVLICLSIERRVLMNPLCVSSNLLRKILKYLSFIELINEIFVFLPVQSEKANVT